MVTMLPVALPYKVLQLCCTSNGRSTICFRSNSRVSCDFPGMGKQVTSLAGI